MKADLDLMRKGKRESLSATIRFVSLALAFLTILALGAVAYYTERGIAASRDWVIHTYQVRSQLNDLELEIVRARASEATYLLTHQKDSLPESQEQTGLAHQTVEALRNLTV